MRGDSLRLGRHAGRFARRVPARERRRDGRVRAALRRRRSTAGTTSPTGALMYLQPRRAAGDRLDEANELWQTTFAGDGEDVIAFAGVAAALERLRDGRLRARDRHRRRPRCRRAAARADRARRRCCRSGCSATTWRSTSPTRRRSGGPSSCSASAIGRRASTYVGDAPTDMQMAGRGRRPGDRDRLGPRRPRRAARGRRRRGRAVGRGVGRGFVAGLASAGRRVSGTADRPGSTAGRAPAAILADGDAPSRAELDAAWPGWSTTGSTSSSPPTAARATRPALGRPDRPLGRRRRLDRAAATLDGAARRPASRSSSCAGRQGRDRHRARAPRRGRGRRRRGSRSSARSADARLDHALANVWLLAHPSLAGRDVRLLDARQSGSGCCAVRRRSRPRRSRSATSSRSSRSAATPTGSTTDGLRYPLRDETLVPRAVARPVERPRCGGRDAWPSGAAGPRRGDPCYALGDEHARRSGEPAPEIALPTRPARSTASPTSAAAGRSSTSTRRTTRPAAPSRPASSATPTTRSSSAARTSGASARRARASKRAFREKFGLPFTLLADVDHARRRGLRLVGREGELRQDVLGHRPDDVPRRSRRAASPGPGRRSSRRATPPRSWRRSTRSRPPRR